MAKTKVEQVYRAQDNSVWATRAEAAEQNATIQVAAMKAEIMAKLEALNLAQEGLGEVLYEKRAEVVAALSVEVQKPKRKYVRKAKAEAVVAA